MPQLDIQEVVAAMVAAVRQQVTSDWKEVKPVLTDFIRRNEARWELLADLYIKGMLDRTAFELRLADEARVLSAQLHAVVVIKKVVAQQASNAAIKVLEDAVKVVLKAVT